MNAISRTDPRDHAIVDKPALASSGARGMADRQNQHLG